MVYFFVVFANKFNLRIPMKPAKHKTLSAFLSPLLLILICCSMVAVLIILEEVGQPTIPAPAPAAIGGSASTGGTPTDEQQADLISYFFGDLPSVVAVPARLVFVAAIFLIAFILHRLAWLISDGLLNSESWGRTLVWSSYRFNTKSSSKPKMRKERRRTIQHLVASAISVAAFGTVLFVGLSQFLSPGALAVVTGLLTAAFGFGARTLIGDLLAGMSNLFEDNFDVDEKVEIAHVTGNVEGVVENVNLRTVSIRAPSGELFIIPNGEVRILRNFSRGRFSTADILLSVLTVDLQRTLPVLEDLGDQAAMQMPDLLETWQVVSEEGILGQHTQLKLIIKTRFGRAAQARTSLLTMVQEHLIKNEITLSD